MTNITEEDEIKTPRVCEACGGNTGGDYDCKWCKNGFQNLEQQSAWRKFRTRMRKISSTYSLLEKITREIISTLHNIENNEAREIVEEGNRALEKWLSAEPDTKARRDASMDISIFQKRALVIIMKRKQGM